MIKERFTKAILNTFTKVWVNRILTHSIVWIYLSYVLAFLGREEIALTLSIAVVTDILGVSIGYFIKSFMETREEENLKFDKQKYEDSNKRYNKYNELINTNDEEEEESGR